MKKILVFCCMLCCCNLHAQLPVTDPASISQRLILFLEQIEESMSQGMNLTEQVSNARELLNLTQSVQDDLKRVSDFISSAKEVAEIAEAGVRIVNKVDKYRLEIAALDLGNDEQYYIMNSLVELGKKVGEKVAEGSKMSNTHSGDGSFNDYERLQMLKAVKAEVLAMESDIDDLFERCLSSTSYLSFRQSLSQLSFGAIVSAN